LSSERELSNKKVLSEIFKSTLGERFVPIQEINFKDEYYLDQFVHNLGEIETKNPKLKKLFLYDRDLRFIYIDIALIVLRINKDGCQLNRKEELWEIILEREWTRSESEEYESLRYLIDYLDLDVRSLFIHILIFMDKLARFLSLVIDAKNLTRKSFDKFKKALKNLRGKEIEEFTCLINENTGWFKTVKDLRDDFIEHHPGASGIIVFSNGKSHVVLTTTEKMDMESKTVYMEFKTVYIKEIDDVLAQLKKFLQILNDFLCNRIEVLPMKDED